MKPFFVLRRPGALFTLACCLLGASAASCGGTGNNNLFGSGGSGAGSTGTMTTSSGGGASSTSNSSSSGGGASSTSNSSSSGEGTSSSSSSSGTTTTSSSSSSGEGTSSSSSSSGTTTTSSSSSSGTTSTSSSSSSSGSVGCPTGYVCVDADPPGGWSGWYYVTETQLPAGPPPQCPQNLTGTTGNADPAGAAQCTACTCGPIVGATCSAPDITCWEGSTTCGGNTSGTDWTSALDDGNCDTNVNLLGGATQMSCKLTSGAMVTNPGSCTPGVSMITNPSPWLDRLDVCGTTTSAGSCGTGQVCIPQGPNNPNVSLCVFMDGTNTCPAGWTKTIVGYSHVDDTRSCSACACGDGATCGDSHYTFYDDATCTASSTGGMGVVGSSMCTDVSAEISATAWSAKATLPQVHGACPASGGQPTGMVTPSGAYTYCCQ